MAKRRRNGSLTGGTGDINPQFYTGVVLQTAINTDVVIKFATPKPSFSATGNKAVVMEILRIWAMTDMIPDLTAPGLINYSATMSFSTHFAVGVPEFNDHNLFGYYQEYVHLAFTAAQGVAVVRIMKPCVLDLTDGAGHGWLLAADYFAVGLRTVATTTNNKGYFKLLYRFKKVGLAEYIGIVQSQQ